MSRVLGCGEYEVMEGMFDLSVFECVLSTMETQVCFVFFVS
jgi:hypothetical protein